MLSTDFENRLTIYLNPSHQLLRRELDTLLLLEKRGKQRLLLPSCIAEIVVRPPTQVPAPVLHPLPRQRIRTVRGNSERDLHVNRVPPPLRSFENRRRNSFQTPRVMNPPLWRVESNRNSVTGHFSTYNPGFLRRPGFARRSDSLNHDACAISSEAVITSLIQDENSMSQQNIGRNETIQPDRGSRVPSTKPITPYATKSVPKVC